MFSTRLLIILILFNVASTAFNPFSIKKKLYQYRTSPESETDNRYVWFTRSISSEAADQTDYQELFHNKFHDFIFRKKLRSKIKKFFPA